MDRDYSGKFSGLFFLDIIIYAYKSITALSFSFSFTDTYIWYHTYARSSFTATSIGFLSHNGKKDEQDGVISGIKKN